MKYSSLLLAWAAGSVAYFLAGWLVFDQMLGGFMDARTTQIEGFKKSPENASMALTFASCAAYALLVALLFWRWTTIRTFGEGFLAGALIGILIAVMTDFYWHATSHFFNDFKAILADIAAAGATVGLLGGVVGWILGRF